METVGGIVVEDSEKGKHGGKGKYGTKKIPPKRKSKTSSEVVRSVVEPKKRADAAVFPPGDRESPERRETKEGVPDTESSGVETKRDAEPRGDEPNPEETGVASPPGGVESEASHDADGIVEGFGVVPPKMAAVHKNQVEGFGALYVGRPPRGTKNTQSKTHDQGVLGGSALPRWSLVKKVGSGDAATSPVSDSTLAATPEEPEETAQAEQSMSDTSRKGIDEHNTDTGDALRHAFGREEDAPPRSDTGRKPVREHMKDTDAALRGAFGRTDEADGKESGEHERKGGFFGADDYRQAINDQSGTSESLGNGEEGSVEGVGVGENVSLHPDASKEIPESAPEGVPLMETESGVEGRALSKETESIEELRKRSRLLKEQSDKARDDYLSLRHKNESRWSSVKKYFFPSRSVPPPDTVVSEVEALKKDWNYKLTLYKDAVVALAKREAVEKNLSEKDRGARMAEALRELDLRGSIENYTAWKNAAWSNREDSNFLRGLGRARDWAEAYRKLDWKKRMAISGALLGAGVAGVAAGSVGLVGVGIAGRTLTRLLGSYGASRGAYEFLEGRANKKFVDSHEQVLSRMGEFGDEAILKRRMKSYADTVQKNLDHMIARNKQRVAGSAALGTLLFLGGSAYANRDAIEHIAGKVSAGFSKFLAQMGIVDGAEGLGDTGALPSGAPGGADVGGSDEVHGVSNTPSVPSQFEQASPASPSEAPFSPPAESGTVSPASSGAEAAAGDMQKSVERVVIGENSSIERAMNALVQDPAESHRAYEEFLEKLKSQGENTVKLDKLFQGKTFPGDTLYVEMGSDGKPHILGIERESGGASLWKKFVRGSEQLARQSEDVESPPVSEAHPFTESSLPRTPISENVPVRAPSLPASAVNPERVKDLLEESIPSPAPVPSLQDTLDGNLPPDSLSARAVSKSDIPLPQASQADSAISEGSGMSGTPLDIFERHSDAGLWRGLVPPVVGAGIGAGVGLGAAALSRNRSQETSSASRKTSEDGRSNPNRTEESERVSAGQDQEADESRLNVIRNAFDQMLGLEDFPRERKQALSALRERYAAYGGNERASDAVFEDVSRHVRLILFGVEEIPDSLFNNSASFASMVMRLRQERGALVDKGEAKETENEFLLRVGVRGYALFQRFFHLTNDRLPAGVLNFPVRDVIRVIADRILRGKTPENLQFS